LARASRKDWVWLSTPGLPAAMALAAARVVRAVAILDAKLIWIPVLNGGVGTGSGRERL
jgi:hypothetical protein